jgi:hypothetical protein
LSIISSIVYLFRHGDTEDTEKNFSIAIHDAPDASLQYLFGEIYQQAQALAGQAQIGQQLRLIYGKQRLNRFDLK